MPARINYQYGDIIPNTRLRFLKDLPSKNKRRQALFVCSCGTKVEKDLNWVRFLNITSCGCYRSEVVTEKNLKHGHAIRGNQSEAYKAWAAMQNRVSCDPYYIDTHICPRWCGEDGFSNFFKDMGNRPKGLTLDRINNNGDYEPLNCRWATWSEQNLNKGY